MSEQPQKSDLNLGIYERRRRRRRIGVTELIAISLSLLWLTAMGSFFLYTYQSDQAFDSLRFVMTLLAIFLPVALIWVAATAAKTMGKAAGPPQPTPVAEIRA